MQNKVQIINSNESWNAKKRYKINTTVSHLGTIYQNSTGINSDPTLGNDWVFVKKQNPVPVAYHNDFVVGISNEFTVTEGILIQNVFLNNISVNGSDWSQLGNIVTVTTAIEGDLVTLTGRN